jgi:DNA gyrase inhibitor GyrI
VLNVLPPVISNCTKFPLNTTAQLAEVTLLLVVSSKKNSTQHACPLLQLHAGSCAVFNRRGKADRHNSDIWNTLNQMMKQWWRS